MESGAATGPLGKASIRGPTPSRAKTNTTIRREWFNTSGWLPVGGTPWSNLPTESVARAAGSKLWVSRRWTRSPWPPQPATLPTPTTGHARRPLIRSHCCLCPPCRMKSLCRTAVPCSRAGRTTPRAFSFSFSGICTDCPFLPGKGQQFTPNLSELQAQASSFPDRTLLPLSPFLKLRETAGRKFSGSRA